MDRQIGDPGEYLNESMASRAVNIRPNMKKVARLDTHHRTYRKYLLTSMAVVAGLLAVAVAIFLLDYPKIAFGIGIMAYAVFLFGWRFRKMLTGDAYTNGLLVPGIITSVNPLQVSVVAEVQNGDGPNPHGIVWGAKQVQVPALTLHPEQLGEQVPCVALFGPAENGIYTDYEPRPLAWGTDELAVIRTAQTTIDPEEWEVAALLAQRTPPAEGSYSVAYFNEDFQLVPDQALTPSI